MLGLWCCVVVVLFYRRRDDVAAILSNGLPGEQVGPALIDILFGAVSPSVSRDVIANQPTPALIHHPLLLLLLLSLLWMMVLLFALLILWVPLIGQVACDVAQHRKRAEHDRRAVPWH